MDNLDRGVVGQAICHVNEDKAAAEAFLHPEEHKWKITSLVEDKVVYQQLSEIFREKMGPDAPQTVGILVRMPVAMSKEMDSMLLFSEMEGYGADIHVLRKQEPQLKDLMIWLETSPYINK